MPVNIELASRDLEALGHFVFEWDVSRGWRSTNAGRALLGLSESPAFMDDATWWAHVHPDDRAKVMALGESLRQGGESRCECTLRIVRSTPQDQTWVLARAQAHDFDADGRPSRVVGTLTEVDDFERTSRTLRQREERIFDALDHARIAWYEREGKSVHGSPVLARIYDLEDPVGPWDYDKILERLEPLERERHRHEVKVATEAEDARAATHVASYRLMHRDGRPHEIEIRYRVERAADPVRTYGLITDVTTTKARGSKFELAMDQAGVAWFERDITSEEISGSRSLWRLYGIEPTVQPLYFDTLAGRVHPEDLEHHAAAPDRLREMSRALGGVPGDGPSRTFRYRVLQADGHWYWTEVRYSTRFDGKGGGTVSGLVLDVNNTQLAADELRAARSRLLLALDVARMATWEMSVETTLFHSHDVFASLVGLPGRGPWRLEEVLGLIHVEDRDAVALALHEIIVDSAAPQMRSAEFRIFHPIEGIRWFEARARRTESTIIGVTADISPRKQGEAATELLRRQLQQAQKMEAIGQLTGGIAHDFNNILAGILGYADLALMRFGLDMADRLAGYIREIQSGGLRARDLVQQLLAFSRQEESDLSATSVEHVAAQSIKLLRPTLPASIDVELRADSNLPPVMADPVQLQQVIMNLCINARDAMGGTGHITLELGRRSVSAARCVSCQQDFDGDFVVIALKDDGPGMAPELQARIFEPFYTTKALGEGTGMGLSMVHGIAHRLGGHVRLDSAPDQGSVFEILLPRAAEPAHEHLPPPATARAPAAGGTILVIDDEPTVARYVAELLDLEGYRVDTSCEPQRALAELLAGEREVDLVITDQTMPHMSGTEFVAQLREARPHLPAIIMSGYSPSRDGTPARDSGAFAYLQKPIEAQALLQVVGMALAAATRRSGQDDRGRIAGRI